MKSTTRKISIFIKEPAADDGKAKSSVGITYENAEGVCEGDYEAFDTAELTDEQIACSVKRLVEKTIHRVPKVENKPLEANITSGTEKSGVRFELRDGKYFLVKDKK
jgi:hypothetical protein